jgi:tRNA(His) guanylyltransferase
MLESSLNEASNPNAVKNELFSKLQIPFTTPFFVRLNGRRFQAVLQKLRVNKPFDKTFAKCLVQAGKAFYQEGLSPALIYVASDEINALFVYAAPFNRRVEKTNSLLAGIVSSAFSLCAQKTLKKSLVVSFDSRIIATTTQMLVEYLNRRQQDAWRNHNNAYAYWMLRKLNCKPSDTAKMLKGWKSQKLHDFLSQHGINLTKTPSWQRRGILIYKRPYEKHFENITTTRWRIKENWNLPVFSSQEGRDFIYDIVEWAELHKNRKEEQFFGSLNETKN